MSREISDPPEAFFVSESIAGKIDMAQFSSGDGTDEILAAAVLTAEISLENGETFKLDVTSCSTTEGESFGIVTSVDSSEMLSLLIGQHVLSVALILSNELVFDVQVDDMKRTIEVQATGGQYYLVALNFEKKNLIING